MIDSHISKQKKKWDSKVNKHVFEPEHELPDSYCVECQGSGVMLNILDSYNPTCELCQGSGDKWKLSL